MAYRVFWTEVAARDLREVHDYIARDSTSYASAFVDKSLSKARLLEQFPFAGRMVPEFQNSSVRELYVHRHRLIFQIVVDSVFILGLIHGARDLAALWDNEGRPEP